MRSVSQSYLSILLLFFFKQKTAYEMRISDWSSDVCSSDLQRCAARVVGHDARSACRVVGIGGGRAGPLGGPVLQALDRIEHAATELTERRPAADHAQLLQRARRELEPGGRFGVGQEPGLIRRGVPPSSPPLRRQAKPRRPTQGQP